MLTLFHLMDQKWKLNQDEKGALWNSAGKYLFKVNNKDTTAYRCCSSVFIDGFEKVFFLGETSLSQISVLILCKPVSWFTLQINSLVTTWWKHWPKKGWDWLQLSSYWRSRLLCSRQLLNFGTTMRKNCSHSEFFWSLFSRIPTEYSVQIREKTDQKNSEYGHLFGHSSGFLFIWRATSLHYSKVTCAEQLGFSYNFRFSCGNFEIL